MSKEDLTAEDFACFRYIWRLPESRSKKLDMAFVLQFSLVEFLERVNSDDHAWKDMMYYDGFALEVVPYQCSIEQLLGYVETMKNKDRFTIKVSCRIYHKKSKKGIAVIRLYQPAADPSSGRTLDAVDVFIEKKEFKL